MKVAIKARRKGGTLEIRYSSLEQLEALLERLESPTSKLPVDNS